MAKAAGKAPRLTASTRRATKRRAENKIVEEASKESFPASDPPASGVPDKPPANADEKWNAARKARTKRGRRTTV